jgi:four helix bundle protein
MKSDFIIQTKMRETGLWIFSKVQTFPKKQRFVLGQQIENSALHCMRLIVEANYARQLQTVLMRLDELNVELEILRELLRLARDLGFISAASLAYVIEQVDVVGKMRGGWAKHYLSSKSRN